MQIGIVERVVEHDIRRDTTKFAGSKIKMKSDAVGVYNIETRPK